MNRLRSTSSDGRWRTDSNVSDPDGEFAAEYDADVAPLPRVTAADAAVYAGPRRARSVGLSTLRKERARARARGERDPLLVADAAATAAAAPPPAPQSLPQRPPLHAEIDDTPDDDHRGEDDGAAAADGGGHGDHGDHGGHDGAAGASADAADGAPDEAVHDTRDAPTYAPAAPPVLAPGVAKPQRRAARSLTRGGTSTRAILLAGHVGGAAGYAY